MSTEITRLLNIMAILRDPKNGCEWDRAQSHETIVPHTIEEAYEVADAVERGNLDDLKDELGDLLFQVVFQSRIAEESNKFEFNDVAQAISDKLEARHPHIFGVDEIGNDTRDERWEALKAQERAQKGAESALEGVAHALPALLRAQKLQKRAARTGFDWPDKYGPIAKIYEELEELEKATSNDDQFEEAGDLLFAVVNLVRAYGINAEEALRAANHKFEARFKGMERLGGEKFTSMSLEEQESLWQQVKQEEKK